MRLLFVSYSLTHSFTPFRSYVDCYVYILACFIRSVYLHHMIGYPMVLEGSTYTDLYTKSDISSVIQDFIVQAR